MKPLLHGWASYIMSVYDEATLNVAMARYGDTCSLSSEMKVGERTARDPSVQCERMGKYQPYPVLPF